MGDNWVHISQICDEIFGKVHKDMGGGEERYICPFHDDTNPSCDVNKSKGVYVCRACGKSGSLYDLAREYNYPKPHLYIPNGNGYVGKVSKITPTTPPPVTSEMIETVQHSQKYLNEHLDLIPKYWNKDVVKELGIGRHQNQWLYPYYDDSEVVGYKLGKITQQPKGIKCRVFPSMDYISRYDKKQNLYIFEGEGDCITGISLGLQGISFTSGAGSIPRDKDRKYDLKWRLKWNIIVICYDNDKTGIDGAIKLKNKLMEVSNNG